MRRASCGAADLTCRAVREILDSGGRDAPLEIIVVNNGSPDAREHLAGWQESLRLLVQRHAAA